MQFDFFSSHNLQNIIVYKNWNGKLYYSQAYFLELTSDRYFILKLYYILLNFTWLTNINVKKYKSSLNINISQVYIDIKRYKIAHSSSTHIGKR